MATRTLKLPTSYTLCVSQSERLVAAIGRNVVIADLANRKRLSSSHPMSHPSDMDFSGDDRFLAVKSTWGEIAILSTEDSSKLTSFRPRRQDEGAPILFSPDGGFLVDGSWSGEIRVRQTSNLTTVEAFEFKGEMITSVSRNSTGDRWLFSHTTIHTPEVSETPRPYLSLWNWPLRNIEQKFEVGLRILNAAVIAPSAQYIAVVGFCDETERTVLRLLNAGGKLLASMPLEHGGTGSSTRWSSDSKLVGTVTKGEFRIYSVPDLTPYVTFTEQYPSDLAFISGCKEMVLGTWNYGRIVQLPRPVE